jgi:ATP phosphoribosyltransferase regulatory subunit
MNGGIFFMNKGLLLEIPYGTRDFLPKDAKVKREIESKLAKNFSLWGYDEIVTPTIEYVDTLTINNRSGIETHLFKFFDKNNKNCKKQVDNFPNSEYNNSIKREISS